MNTSEVLNRAADLIEERGWTADGTGWDPEPGRPLCLEGGIAAAIGGGLCEMWVSSAYTAVAAYLKSRTTRLPFSWNDHLFHDRVMAACQSHDYRLGHFDRDAAQAEAHEWATGEVIAVLRAAALIEAAKETAPTRRLPHVPQPRPTGVRR